MIVRSSFPHPRNPCNPWSKLGLGFPWSLVPLAWALCLPCFGQRIGTFDHFSPQQFSQSQEVIYLLNGASLTNANLAGGTISNGTFVGTITFPVGPVFTNAIDADQFVYDTRLHIVSGARITNGNLLGTVVLPAGLNLTNLNVYASVSLPSGTSITNLDAHGSGLFSVQLGNAAAAGADSIAAGFAATTAQTGDIALGSGASASGGSSGAMGTSATSAFANSFAVGVSATTTAPNQIRLGDSTYDVSAPGTITLASAGSKLRIKQGANAAMGSATLAGGSVGVANTLVTGSTRIFLCIQSASGTVGSVYVNGQTNAAGFGIKSTSASDNSTVAYLLVEPAP